MRDGEHHSPSYKKAPCCNCHCFAFETNDPDDPCWGKCYVIDEQTWEDEDGHTDSAWVHACEGHESTWDGEDYKPEPEQKQEKVEPPPPTAFVED